MATQNLTITTSDLSGSEDAATITFGIKGTWYEIDLTPEEEEGLSSALKTYLEVARKAQEKKDATKRKDVIETTAEQREIIRAWAVENNFEIADRGRIPKKVTAAYIKANGGLPDA